MHRITGILLSLSFLTSCYGPAVYPPRHPVDPVPVFLFDYGYHSSLLFPSQEGRFVEYVYADWPYGALNQVDPCHMSEALFFSQSSAFGREIVAKAGATYPEPPNKPKRVMRLDLSKADVDRVAQALDARYEKHRDTEVYNSQWGFRFVKDDVHYSWLHNCNHETAATLRSLCCDVEGGILLSGFIVKPSRITHCEGEKSAKEGLR